MGEQPNLIGESQCQGVGSPPPRSWADYRDGCIRTYRGGHHEERELKAFHHGMETVFRLLEAEFPPAEQCKAVPAMLDALHSIRSHIVQSEQVWDRRFGTSTAVNGDEILSWIEPFYAVAPTLAPIGYKPAETPSPVDRLLDLIAKTKASLDELEKEMEIPH